MLNHSVRRQARVFVGTTLRLTLAGLIDEGAEFDQRLGPLVAALLA